MEFLHSGPWQGCVCIGKGCIYPTKREGLVTERDEEVAEKVYPI